MEKRFSKGLSALVSYTGGKLIDDVSQTVNFLGAAAANAKQDFYNRAAERSISAQDVSQRLVISGIYELPIGKRQKFLTSMPAAVDLVLGGWQANAIMTFQTGTPIQIGNGQNALNIFSANQRASATGVDPYVGGPISDRLNRYFNQAAFVQSGNFVMGNAGTLPAQRTRRRTEQHRFLTVQELPISRASQRAGSRGGVQPGQSPVLE